MKTALSALFVVLALCASPARAAVEHVGSCTDPNSTACVLGDGSFEYLSVGGATGTAALTQRLGEGWELGSRRDFLDMVLRNSPTFRSWPRARGSLGWRSSERSASISRSAAWA